MKLIGAFHDFKKHLNSYIVLPTWFPSSIVLSENMFDTLRNSNYVYENLFFFNPSKFVTHVSFENVV